MVVFHTGAMKLKFREANFIPKISHSLHGEAGFPIHICLT